MLNPHFLIVESEGLEFLFKYELNTIFNFDKINFIDV